MNIQGMSALVTGGGSGLGEATARELARLGAKVAVLDLNLENAQKVAADIGGIAVPCNVSDPDSMAQAIETAAAAHGHGPPACGFGPGRAFVIRVDPGGNGAGIPRFAGVRIGAA